MTALLFLIMGGYDQAREYDQKYNTTTPDTHCRWTERLNAWHTGCGRFVLATNHVGKDCPYCGLKIYRDKSYFRRARG